MFCGVKTHIKSHINFLVKKRVGPPWSYVTACGDWDRTTTFRYAERSCKAQWFLYSV